MPEGDTIANAARRLDAALTGRTLVRAEVRRAVRAPTTGVTVEAVEPRGKHLLIRFADGTALRTHLRMHGRWDLYRPGERWRRAAHRARVVLETDDGTTAVCFDAPEVELLTGAVAEQARLGHLGPDLCRADADLDAAVDRMALLDPATEVGVALFDQRVACGVGNVYKSEVCFACRVDPFTPLERLDRATCTALIETSARLLRANLRGGRRVTHGRGYAVYGRTGRPCPVCGTRIRSRAQGEQARRTYWCPACQSPVDAR